MLTDSKIRAAKPKPKPFKLYDQKGLYMLVTPSGGRLWRLKYHLHGRERGMALGKYPEVRLPKARQRRDDARKLLADGINPAAARRAEKRAVGNTLKAIALEFLEKQGCQKDKRRLEMYVFPAIGDMPITTVTTADLLACLRRIEQRGTHETAHRTRSICGRIFRFAIATDRAERDVAADLKGALTPVKTRHFPALTKPADVAALLRAISDFEALPTIQLALRLAPYVFVRPGELRAAEWAEFEGDLWRIPAEKMKMDRAHSVPLSLQARAIVDELRQWSGDSRYLFPNVRSKDRCMSENTLNAALRRMGYGKEQLCAHGFRTTASTLLNEMSWRPDVIELQLAHKDSSVRAIYNRSELIPERIEMMQAWADYLDELRDGSNVVAIRARC